MAKVTYPLSNRRARALALGAFILTVVASLRARSSTPVAARSARSGDQAARPQHDLTSAHDLQNRPGTPAPTSSPRRRRPFARALAVAVAAGVVALLALVVGPSTSRATIDWSSGFEGQSYAPWQGLQANPTSQQFQYVTSPVRTGQYAARFSISNGQGTNWGNERSELCCGPTSEGVPGTDEYWAWSTQFPTSWSEPYHWGMIFQFHSGDDTVPPIAFDAGADAMWLDVRTGEVNVAAISTSYSTFPQILTTLSKGHWNDFVVHVNWSATNGTIEVWHRVPDQSQAFVKIASLTGIPTLQTRGGKPDGVYTKWGLYRGASPSGQADSVIYDDSLVKGSSFDEVVSAAWGGSAAASSSPPPTPAAPAPSAPAPPAPSSPAPAPSAPAPAAPAPSSGGGGSTGGGSTTTAAAPPAAAPATSASPTTALATNGSKKGGSTSKAQATASARTLATAKARVRMYARAAKAAGARAHGYSLVAAAARAKARAYYRAAAKAEAEVRALTRPKRRPAFVPVGRLRPN